MKKRKKVVVGRDTNHIQKPSRANERFAKPPPPWAGMFWALVIFGFSFWLYSNTFKHGYVLDDLTQIEQNTLVQQGSKAIPELFMSSYRHGYDQQNSGLYRPMSNIFFALEYDYAGRQPNGIAKPGIFHRNNVWLFALSCFILFFALRRMFAKWHMGFAVAATLLFAAHPIHTEVVANIKSRDEILCFLGFISAIFFLFSYVKYTKPVSLFASVLCYTFAQFSKESAITYIAVFPLLLWFFTDFSIKKIAITCSFYLIPMVVFLGLMFSILTSLESNHYVDVIQNSLMAAKDFNERSATTVAILGRYLLLLVVPYPLLSDYSFNYIPNVGWLNWQPILSLLVYLGFAYLAIKKIRQKDIHAFAILFFVITMALVSNVVITISWTLGERFLYQPSLAFCLVLVFWLFKISKTDINNRTGSPMKSLLFFSVMLIAIMLAYTLETRSRSMDWKDNLTLFSTDVRTAPENARLHAMYAQPLGDSIERKYANIDPELDSGITQDLLLQTSVDEYRKAIEIYPYHAFVNGLGTALNQQRKFAEAKYYFLKAIAINDSVPDYYHNLGIAYFGMKQYDSSAWAYEKVLHYSPDYAKTFVNLANVYNLLKRRSEAISTIRKAIAKSPADRRLYMNLCVYFRDGGQLDSANFYYNKATGR